jgi:Zn-finger nucleic acid-binding protein
MEKVFIPSEGINIDICTDGCGGIFFDNREFDTFNEIHEDISIIEEKLQNKEFEPVDDKAVRICPACGGQMVKNTSKMNGNVVVDDCYLCGGKFLDNGELQKIREEFINDKDRSKSAMAFLYNEVGSDIAHLDNKLAEAKRKRNLGQKLFYSIMKL